VITSDSLALRAVFSAGAVFVNPQPAGICAGISAVRSDYARLSAEVRQLRRDFAQDWQAKCARLRLVLAGVPAAVPPGGSAALD
jgi:hypothetical protein